MKCVILLLVAATCASAQLLYSYNTSPFYGSYYNPYFLTLLRKRRSAEEPLSRARRSAPAPAPATPAEDQQADAATLFYSGYQPTYYSTYGFSRIPVFAQPYLRKKRDVAAHVTAQEEDQQAQEALYLRSVYSPGLYRPYVYSYPYANLWK